MNDAQNILDMTGRIALVTGAGQGIGRQVALHLASHGAAGIVVNDFYRERAEAVAEEVRGLGTEAVAYQCDVSRFEDVRSMIEMAATKLGTIDVLVNNAGNRGPGTGSEPLKPFWESSPDDWKPWLDTNLYGVLNCTRHVLPGMRQAHRGSIVSIISEASRYGDANLELYASAKAAAAGFMRSIARGMARDGIRANSVAIAATRTPAIAATLEDESLVKKQLRLYPLRRYGEPSDVANAVLFLASDAASFVTGQVYAVNGGFLFGL